MLKPDFFRFFSIGFAAGAVLVFTALAGGNIGSRIADGVVPPAEAASAH